MKWRFGMEQFSSDVNWRDVEYCAVDLETTGLDFLKDEIISFGVVQIRQGRVVTEDNLYRKVHPRVTPSLSSIKVHGLRRIDLEEADRLEVVLPELVSAVDGKILIAHAAWIESAFLQGHFRQVHRRLSKKVLDTAALARRTGYAAELNGSEPSLESLAKRMHLPVYSPHHALGDAMTTAVMFLALATEIERESMAKGRDFLSLKDLLKISKNNSWRPKNQIRLSR